TSAHDDQTLRELHGRLPAAEFLEWGLRQGVFARDGQGAVTRGPGWGDPRRFCESEAEFRELCAATPALPGLGRAGPRPGNTVSRALRLNQAIGREAIHAELRPEDFGEVATFRVVETEATSKEAHLNSPDLGARLAPTSLARLAPEDRQVQIL